METRADDQQVNLRICFRWIRIFGYEVFPGWRLQPGGRLSMFLSLCKKYFLSFSITKM